MKIKTFLVLILAIALIPAVSVFAAGNNDKPVLKKGAKAFSVKGQLVKWSDVKKISMEEMMSTRKLKPVLNMENPRKIKKAPSADPVVQRKALGRDMLALAGPLIDFAGMSLSANGAGWPPDTCGDVGPNHYVQAVNTSIGIYNKTTGALISASTFDAFFGGSAPCNNDNNGDPIVLYDRYNQRWFILDFAWTSTSGPFYYSIAASQSSDPTGSWWQYCFQADSSLLNDYPKCGVWHDGIYTTANMFVYSSGAFQHVKIHAFKTPDIYNGTLTSQSLVDNSAQAWSILPSNSISATAPVGPNYMYAVDANEFGGSSIDAIYVWKLDVDWNTPANTTWTGHSTLNVAAYGLTASRIPQSGTSVQLDSLYGRLMYPANYRNFGTHESVYLNHVAESNSKRVTRWYEIRINGGTSSIYQQGTYDPDSLHRWMGSIAGDKNGNIALAYSVSASTMKPSIRYSGRLSTDPLGQLSQGEASLIEGTGHQTTYTRWGDYSHLTIDPSDDETFWYTTEYYVSSGTNWQTRIGSFKLASATSPPVANFTASATTITAGQSVNFTDTSTNSPTSWSWTFAGGTPSASTAQNPSVTYNTAGTYTVSLTATNSAGSDTNTKTNYITVNAVGSGFCDDFNDGNANGWTAATGTWTVVSNQLDGSSSGGPHRNISPAGDVGVGTISVDWTSLTGQSYTNGMVVFAYQDEQNYRVADFRDGSNNWFIKEYVNGSVSTKAQFSENINTNQQYSMVVDIAASGLVTVSADGVQKVSYNFGNVITGKVGVAIQNSHSRFDNFCVDTASSTLDDCDNFNDGDASDWTFVDGGTWSAATNQLEGSDPTNFSYALAPLPDMASGTVSVDMTALTGNSYTNAQIVFGWVDSNNHYLADVRVGANAWRIRRKVNGTLSNLASFSQTINANQLYQLELVVTADGLITLYADGVSKVSYNNGAAISGAVGVSIERAVSLFDNFCVNGVAAN
jgi:PKD repeat protein